MKNHVVRILALFSSVFLTFVALSSVNGRTDEKTDHHGQRIDANNGRECVSCHDGTIGQRVLYCTAKCDMSKGHPVFKRYPPAGKDRDFRPRAVAASRGIRFENGQVTCNSCHNISINSPYHLIMNNRNSSLCLSCHIR